MPRSPLLAQYSAASDEEPRNEASELGDRRMPLEVRQNSTPGPKRKEQSQVRTLCISQQGKGKPRERNNCPQCSGAQAPTWSMEALVIGTGTLTHDELWAFNSGRRLRTAKAQGSAMPRLGGTQSQVTLGAGGYSNFYNELWVGPWRLALTQSSKRLGNVMHKTFLSPKPAVGKASKPRPNLGP